MKKEALSRRETLKFGAIGTGLAMLGAATNALGATTHEKDVKFDEKYVGDITYIPTSEGWLYLATVIDLYSRKIVGWLMDENMNVSLVNDALKMPLETRQPPKGLIWHTDRGSQYATYEHKDLLNFKN